MSAFLPLSKQIICSKFPRPPGIYDLYINGWSTTEIAELLTSYGRKTKLGNEVWNPTSIDGVIENERHCGDVRSRKTYTPDFKTHKSVKNRQNRKQYKRLQRSSCKSQLRKK